MKILLHLAHAYLIKSNKKIAQDNLKVMPDEWTFSYKWYSRTDPRFGKTRWTFEKKPNTKIAAVNTKKSLNTTMSAAKPNVPTASAIKPKTPIGAIFITQLIIHTMASTIVFTPFKIGSRFFHS